MVTVLFIIVVLLAIYGGAVTLVLVARMAECDHSPEYPPTTLWTDFERGRLALAGTILRQIATNRASGVSPAQTVVELDQLCGGAIAADEVDHFLTNLRSEFTSHR